jgi:hypothetical protein
MKNIINSFKNFIINNDDMKFIILLCATLTVCSSIIIILYEIFN